MRGEQKLTDQGKSCAIKRISLDLLEQSQKKRSPHSGSGYVLLLFLVGKPLNYR